MTAVCGTAPTDSNGLCTGSVFWRRYALAAGRQAASLEQSRRVWMCLTQWFRPAPDAANFSRTSARAVSSRWDRAHSPRTASRFHSCRAVAPSRRETRYGPGRYRLAEGLLTNM